MNLTSLIIGLLVGAVVGALVLLLRGRGKDKDLAVLEARLENEKQGAAEREVHLKQSREELREAFKALSADALKSSNEQFLSLAKIELAKQQQGAQGELEKRLQAVDELVKPIGESLGKVNEQIQKAEKDRAEHLGGLGEQLKNFGEDQRRLRDETRHLVEALRKPSVRGQWGELQLRRVVEMAGMMNHVDFHEQAATDAADNRLRPDMKVKLPGGQQVIVDAKTPLEAYLQALDASDEATRAEQLVRHARQVRDHIGALSRKAYWEQFDPSPEFVVMFLPSESIFYAALEQDPTLIEEGVAQRVILATPTTLIALLRTVAYGWQQQALADNARDISALGLELYKRLGVLARHFEKLGKSLDKSVEHYNDAVGSLETRVLTAARKFPELSVGEPGALPELDSVDRAARQAQAPELIGADGDEDA